MTELLAAVTAELAAAVTAKARAAKAGGNDEAKPAARVRDSPPTPLPFFLLVLLV